MHILAIDGTQTAPESLSRELKALFQEADIRAVHSFSSAVDWAAELAKQDKRLDYAFVDLCVDGDRGLETARHLKQLHPKLNLIFCADSKDYAYDAFTMCAKGYLLKPVLSGDIERVLDEMTPNWRKDLLPPKQIRIRTFGHFAVFPGDKPMHFKREKAKELLAYLVDRQGSPVTTEQIAMILWEGELYDRRLKNKTTAVISSLRTSLAEYGIGDILLKTWNQLALDVTAVVCDAYAFEEGKPWAINAYRGEYMANYSWGEFTNGRYLMMDERRNRFETTNL